MIWHNHLLPKVALRPIFGHGHHAPWKTTSRKLSLALHPARPIIRQHSCMIGKAPQRERFGMMILIACVLHLSFPLSLVEWSNLQGRWT